VAGGIAERLDLCGLRGQVRDGVTQEVDQTKLSADRGSGEVPEGDGYGRTAGVRTQPMDTVAAIRSSSNSSGQSVSYRCAIQSSKPDSAIGP
jgi:hypothetical protein